MSRVDEIEVFDRLNAKEDYRLKKASDIKEPNWREYLEFDETVHLKRYKLLTNLCKTGDSSLGVVHDRI